MIRKLHTKGVCNCWHKVCLKDCAGAKWRVASAIEIARPVNLSKALRALETMGGVVRDVEDAVILEHKAMVGRWDAG